MWYFSLRPVNLLGTPGGTEIPEPGDRCHHHRSLSTLLVVHRAFPGNHFTVQLWGPVFLDLDTFCALSCNAPVLIPLAFMEKPFSVEIGVRCSALWVWKYLCLG